MDGVVRCQAGSGSRSRTREKPRERPNGPRTGFPHFSSRLRAFRLLQPIGKSLWSIRDVCVADAPVEVAKPLARLWASARARVCGCCPADAVHSRQLLRLRQLQAPLQIRDIGSEKCGKQARRAKTWYCEPPTGVRATQARLDQGVRYGRADAGCWDGPEGQPAGSGSGYRRSGSAHNRRNAVTNTGAVGQSCWTRSHSQHPPSGTHNPRRSVQQLMAQRGRQLPANGRPTSTPARLPSDPGPSSRTAPHPVSLQRLTRQVARPAVTRPARM